MPKLSSPHSESAKAPRKPKSPVEKIDPAESAKEADRLITEGLLIRWGSLQRRFKLQGPLNFDAPAKVIPPVTSFKELVPTFLKKQPEHWTVTPDGFALQLERPDAAVLAKLINARRDELGVYSCNKVESGWVFLVEF